MPSLKLTKDAVKALQAPDPSGKQVLYWDPEKRGLGVLCSGISKTKTWVVQANLNGKARRITIGPTNVDDPDQAWERARPILSDLYAGIDPKAERRRQAQASITVEQALEKYLTLPRLSEKTRAFYRSLAQKNLTPWLDRPLRGITGDDVESRFAAISKDVAQRKAAGKSKGGVNVTGAATANLSLHLFGSIWNHMAERDASLGRNPIAILRRQWHPLERRSRRLWDEDFPTFYKAVLALPNMTHRDLILFGMFTGLREQECAGLSWEEVDLRHRIIHIPASRMKNRKPFELPMSSFIYDLLVARRAIGWDGPFVFPGQGKSGVSQSFSFAMAQVKAASGLVLSPHDLRRSYISVAQNCEISAVALKLLVSHSVGNDVTSGYVVLSDADLRRAAQKVADRLMRLCGIAAPQAENVTRMG
jgi:integrase